MKGKFNIDEEVEKTLLALDDHERVEASPYFYSRLAQKLNQTENSSDQPNFSFTRIWHPTLLSFLILINVFTYMEVLFASTAKDGLATLAYEYNIDNAHQQSVEAYDYALLIEE